ncbi:HlyD family efflux transporter periplasmic adaptor subunit [Patescibacteria group bacterium]|nr:MAG: HlyD family efflux transporter periplasmic adaptor subunit [Patescibacteria group bacterium]
MKRKYWIIGGIVVLAIGGLVYRGYKKSHPPAQYETVKIQRGDLKQTVEVTGKVEANDDLSLRFEVPGTVGNVAVKEGQKVKKGQTLASLRLADLNAAVAQAAANLNQKLAGATQSERDYYKAVMEQAQADWDKAKVDTAASIATAESAYITAKNNLKLAEGGENSLIVNNAYDNAIITAQTSLSVLDDGLTQADNILGIDNTLANDSFESYLSLLDLNKLNLAKSSYATAKEAKAAARAAISALAVKVSSHSDVDSALVKAADAATRMNTLLSQVSEVLYNTAPMGSLTQASLDAKKTTIETTRASVNAQYKKIVEAQQAIVDAKSSYSNYQVAYDKAAKDLADAKAAAESALKIKEALYNQAYANWQNKTSPTRAVDVAAYRAALAQAAANRNKAIIAAPIDGQVAKINKKVGELVTSADVMINLISPHFVIKVDVPETDVSKLTVGDQAAITLDAWGSDTKFSGGVTAIESNSTEIQDVVYYKVKIRIMPASAPVKAGMTANITVDTDARAGVLFVPLRSVRTDVEDKRFVKVLENGEEKDVYVRLGLKANEGKVEILEGLTEGQEVILSIKK